MFTLLIPSLGDEATLRVSKTSDAVEALEAALVDDHMVVIPRGGVYYGGHPSHPGWSRDQVPQHLVEVSAFAMDRREVTYGDYMRCVDAMACPTEPVLYTVATLAARGDSTESVNEALPMAYVSWEDAVLYCQFMDARLPSEVEWERAARGATGSAFPWGDTFACHRARTSAPGCDNVADTTEPADAAGAVSGNPSAIAGASPFGVEGLAGSVWEWTADWYAEPTRLSGRMNRDPLPPPSGPGRVVKGGDFASPPRAIGWRAYRSESTRSAHGGFRCAVDIAPPAQAGMFELFGVIHPDRSGPAALFASPGHPLVPRPTSPTPARKSGADATP